MKKLLFLLIIVFLSCDSENAADCFQRTGSIVQQEFNVPEFTRILVNPNIEMILKQGEATSVVVETGDNLLNEVTAVVEDNQLILQDTNDCGFFRALHPTKIFVTAPDITEIRSATQFDIKSDGVLLYPNLQLLSEDFGEVTGTTTGTFVLEVNSSNISIVANNIASFFVSGEVENLNVGFFSGTGRFEGADLMANAVQVYHRGTNTIIVNPRQSIKGQIRSTGDVIAVHKPQIIEVEQFFTGGLVFQ